MKIRNSDQIVAQELGPGLVRFFEITSRRAASGAPTFSLLYIDGRNRLNVASGSPLSRIRELLREIAATNDLRVGELRYTLSEGFAANRFAPVLLQDNCGYHWCHQCRGLQKGRVALDNGGGYVTCPEGDAPYGYSTTACQCPNVTLSIEEVPATYGIAFDGGGLDAVIPPIVRWYDSKWDLRYLANPDATDVRELGNFRTWAEAQEAAARGTYYFQTGRNLLDDWRGARVSMFEGSPLGDFDSFAAAQEAAQQRVWSRAVSRDEAEQCLRQILDRWNRGIAPRGLVRCLTKSLGAEKAIVTSMETRYDVSFERWILQLGEEWFVLEEHFNPRAGTCGSRVSAITAEVAERWRHHS